MVQIGSPLAALTFPPSRFTYLDLPSDSSSLLSLSHRRPQVSSSVFPLELDRPIHLVWTYSLFSQSSNGEEGG